MIRRSFLLLSTLFMLNACGGKNDMDDWTPAEGVIITAYKTDPDKDGKQFLNVIYENEGVDTLDKIKYELITSTGGKPDTILRTIDPEEYINPKDKHLVPRGVGEEPATFEEVKVGRIWVKKR
jgi:hypothetical protein